MGIICYVDGSCKKNGQKNNEGGFGVVVFENEKIIYTYQKKSVNTTNNREELKAILYTFLKFGVQTFQKNFSTDEIPIVYSDSAYAVNTFNSWMFTWERRGWIKRDENIPENLDLIQAYFNHYQNGYRIDLRKIKGHSGNLGNELADKLATGEEN